MTIAFELIRTDLAILLNWPERIGVLLQRDGKMDQVSQRVNRLTKGLLRRLVEDEDFSSPKQVHVYKLQNLTKVNLNFSHNSALSLEQNAATRSCDQTLNVS